MTVSIRVKSTFNPSRLDIYPQVSLLLLFHFSLLVLLQYCDKIPTLVQFTLILKANEKEMSVSDISVTSLANLSKNLRSYFKQTLNYKNSKIEPCMFPNVTSLNRHSHLKSFSQPALKLGTETLKKRTCYQSTQQETWSMFSKTIL